MITLFSSLVLGFSLAVTSVSNASLKTIGEALQLPEAEIDSPISFVFTGEVLSRNGGLITIKDKTGSVVLIARNASFAKFTRGSIIRALGEMSWGPQGDRALRRRGRMHWQKQSI